MPTIYAKVSLENSRYLDRIAETASGYGATVSKARAIDLILTEARTRGWGISLDTLRLTVDTDPGKDD